MNVTTALKRIHAEMDGVEWSPDTLEAINTIMEQAGLPTGDPDSGPEGWPDGSEERMLYERAHEQEGQSFETLIGDLIENRSGPAVAEKAGIVASLALHRIANVVEHAFVNIDRASR